MRLVTIHIAIYYLAYTTLACLRRWWGTSQAKVVLSYGGFWRHMHGPLQLRKVVPDGSVTMSTTWTRSLRLCTSTPVRVLHITADGLGGVKVNINKL